MGAVNLLDADARRGRGWGNGQEPRVGVGEGGGGPIPHPISRAGKGGVNTTSFSGCIAL
jgi:hypothetical protein